MFFQEILRLLLGGGISFVSLFMAFWSIFKGIMDQRSNRKFIHFQTKRLEEIVISSFKSFLINNKLAWSSDEKTSMIFLPDISSNANKFFSWEKNAGFWKDYFSDKSLVYRTKITKIDENVLLTDMKTKILFHENAKKATELLKKWLLFHQFINPTVNKILEQTRYSPFVVEFLLDDHIEETQEFFHKILEKYKLLELKTVFLHFNKYAIHVLCNKNNEQKVLLEAVALRDKTPKAAILKIIAAYEYQHKLNWKRPQN